MQRNWRIFTFILTIFCHSYLYGQILTDLTPALPFEHSDYDPFIVEQTLRHAETALDMGLSTIAEHHYLELINALDLPPNYKERILFGLIDSYLQQYNLEKAAHYLNSYEFIDKNRYAIRYALAHYLEPSLDNLLKTITPQVLPEKEKPWFYILQGLAENQANRRFLAQDYFEQALEKSTSPVQKAWIESLILAQQYPTTGISLDQLQELGAKLKRMEAHHPHFQSTLELYTFHLHQHNKTDDALHLLNQRLKIVAKKQSPDEISTLQMIALIAQKSPEGLQALQRLLNPGFGLNVNQMALYQLTKYQTEDALAITLSNLTHSVPAHPLFNQAIILQTILYLNHYQFNEAQDNLSKIINPNPDEERIRLKLSADLAFQRKQLKTAIDYLLQLEKLTTPAFKKAEILGWIGDLYWIDQQFTEASNFYSQSLPYAAYDQKEHLVYQAALSYLKINKVDEVIHILDHHHLSNKNQWKIEWAISDYFRKQKEPHLALNHLLKIYDKPHLSPSLKARFYWLISRIYLEIHSEDKALEHVQKLITFLEITPATAFHEDNFDEIMTESLLLKADILMALNDIKKSSEILYGLRQNYPNTAAAERSYLMEAYYEANAQHPIKAQHAFLQLADYYPHSTYAPYALLNAAIVASHQYTTHYQKEAIKYLNRILEHYPASDIVFQAHHEQAKILSQMGAFKEAELIYQQLIKNLTDPIERYTLILSQADCCFAQSQEDPKKLQEAIHLYERIFEQPHIPLLLKNESGYKLAHAFEKAENLQKAEKIYWHIITDFIHNPSPEAIHDHYWITRSIFSLADLLKYNHKPNEAKSLYQLIIDYQLPGIQLAQDQLLN